MKTETLSPLEGGKEGERREGRGEREERKRERREGEGGREKEGRGGREGERERRGGGVGIADTKLVLHAGKSYFSV